MVSGRQKEHDRMKIVNDFIEWAKNNPDALTVPQFAVTVGIHSGMMVNWAAEDKFFREAYNIGKEYIGNNRLKATLNYNSKEENGKLKLEKSIYTQTLGNYDLDVRNYQREERKFDHDMKKAEETQGTSEQNQKIDELLTVMKSTQEALKSDESKQSKE
jgi:hypothetical protein